MLAGGHIHLFILYSLLTRPPSYATHRIISQAYEWMGLFIPRVWLTRWPL